MEDEEKALAIRNGASIAYNKLTVLVDLAEEHGWAEDIFGDVEDLGEDWGRTPLQRLEEALDIIGDIASGITPRTWEGKEKYDEDKKRFRGAMDGISKARGGSDTWFGVEDIIGDRYSRLEKDKD